MVRPSPGLAIDRRSTHGLHLGGNEGRAAPRGRVRRRRTGKLDQLSVRGSAICRERLFQPDLQCYRAALFIECGWGGALKVRIPELAAVGLGYSEETHRRAFLDVPLVEAIWICGRARH
jgi:hypothetical protein